MALVLADNSALLYPPPTEAGPSRPNPNIYRPFQLLDSQFEARLKAAVAEEEQRLEAAGGSGLNGELSVRRPELTTDPPSLVSALTKALCCGLKHTDYDLTH